MNCCALRRSVVAVCVSAASSVVGQTPYTWSLNGNGNWSVNANWSPNTGFPVAGDSASFAAATGRTITIDANSNACDTVSVSGAGNWNWTANPPNHLNVSTAFNYAGSGNSSLNTVLAGTASLAVTGGQLNLNKNNKFSGGVTIDNAVVLITGGSTTLGADNPLGVSATPVALGVGANDATLQIGNGAGNTWRPIDVVAGSGARILTTYNANSGGNFAGDITLNKDLSVIFNAGGCTLSGIVSGTGGIIKGGTAVGSGLVLSGLNTFTGDVVIDSGYVQIQNGDTVNGNDNPLGKSTNPVKLGTGADAAELRLYRANSWRDITVGAGAGARTIRPSAGNALANNTLTGAIVLNKDLQIMGISDANGDGYVRYLGAISGNHAIIKTGNGSSLVSGAKTYTGGTRLEQGTLLIDADNVLGPGDLTFAGGGVYVLGDNFTLTNKVKVVYPHLIASAMATSGTAQKTITLAGPVELTGDTRVFTYLSYTANQDRNLEILGNIADGAEFYGLRKTDYSCKGTLTLSGTNAFDGGVVLDQGTIVCRGDNTGVTGGFVANYGTLQGVARSSGSPFGANAIVLNGTAATLQLDAVNGVSGTSLGEVVFRNSSPLLYVKGVAGGGEWNGTRLTRDGRAMLVVRGSSGSAPNPLTADDKFKLGAPPTVVNGIIPPYIVESSGDFLTYDGDGTGIKRVAAYTAGDINAAPATAIYSAPGPQTLDADREVYAVKTASNIAGSGLKLAIGSGGLLVSGGTPTIDCDLDFGDKEGLFWNRVDTILNGAIMGSDGFTKGGANRLTVNTANSYNGVTTIVQGEMRLGVDNALPTDQPLTIVGGTLDLYGKNQTITDLTMGRGNLCNRNRTGTASILNVSGQIVYTGHATIDSAANAPASAILYSGPDEDNPPNTLTLNLMGPTTFAIADGPQTPDMCVGGRWYMDNDNDYYVGVTGTGNTPLTKRGPGFLQFYNNTAFTFTGDIAIEEGIFHGWVNQINGGHFGNAANDVYLTRNGIISFGGGGTSFKTDLGDISFAGGNRIRCNLGNNLDINLATLARVAGSRGTCVLTGTGASNDHFDSRARQFVAGWKTPNPDPDENNMTPPMFVNAGLGADSGQANFCKVNNTDGRINTFGTGDPNYATSFPTSPTGIEKIYLAAAATLTADKSVWALRTAFGVAETGDCTITLGSGGLILNSDIQVDTKVKFGASGDREAFVYVAGAPWPYMHTAVLADKLITSAGLTKFGLGVLTLTADSSDQLSGVHWVNEGTLRLAHASALAAQAEVNIERGATVDIAGNYTLDYVFKGLGSITTGANLLTATGVLSPGFSVGTLTVEDLLLDGSYVWEYDGTNSDAVACTTLSFGSGASVDCQWLGSGEPAMGSYTLFTYRGTDPNVSVVTVAAPAGLQGELSVDSANKRVLLALGEFVSKGTLILVR